MKARLEALLGSAFKPVAGLLSVLFAAAGFVVFLAALTFLIRFIME